MRLLSVPTSSKLHSLLFLCLFVSIFMSLLIGLHILTKNPTSFLLLTSLKQLGLVHLPIHIHTQTHPCTWRALELRIIYMAIITVKNQETDANTKLSSESLRFSFFFERKYFMGGLRWKLQNFIWDLKHCLCFTGKISPCNPTDCIYVQNKSANVHPLHHCILDICLQVLLFMVLSIIRVFNRDYL